MIPVARSFRQSGLTLLELLIAMLLAGVLLLGLVQLVTVAGSATLLQDNQATLQDRIRHVGALLHDSVGQAGYSFEPWKTGSALPAVAPGTEDGVSANSDRLVLQAWSDLNCFGNRNPDVDADGKPRFYILENRYNLNGSGQLARMCRYGPSNSELVTQVRRQGLVPGVESFQLLFGEDRDGDGSVDRWVKAAQWLDEKRVKGIRVGFLLAGPDEVRQSGTRTYEVLDAPPRIKRDGRLRQSVELSLAIRGRSP